MYPRLLEIPEIFGIGPLTIYTYGVMLAAAYLLGLQLAIVRSRKAGLDPGRMLDLGVYIVIAALIGAKLLLLLVNFNYFRNNPNEILVLARSGGVFYGGLITATLVAFWYIRRHKLPFWTTCDMFAPGIALGHVIGRMGCLDGRLLLRKANIGAVGGHIYRSFCCGKRRHAAECAAAPDPGV